MAAGAFTLFNWSKKKLLDGTINLSTATLYVALATNAQALDATFVGPSAECRYSDLSAEVPNGSGYTTGGNAMTSVALTRVAGAIAGDTVMLDADDATWNSATITAKYGVVYAFSNGNKDLIGFIDLETTSPTGVSDSNGTFAIQWNAGGLNRFS